VTPLPRPLTTPPVTTTYFMGALPLILPPCLPTDLWSVNGPSN
jgi:hypothetical protein